MCILVIVIAVCYRIIKYCEPSSVDLLNQLKITLGGCPRNLPDPPNNTSSPEPALNSCELSHQGHERNRVLVRLTKGGNFAFCRVVGDYPQFKILCTKVKDDGRCSEPVKSDVILDMGYDHSQRWKDRDGDGNIDFCRTVGTYPNKFEQCMLGPDFNNNVEFQ